MKMSFIVVRSFLLVVIGALSTSLAMSQISGPDPVFGGSSATYTFNNGILYTKGNWQISQGVINSFSKSGTTYTCNVTWNQCNTIGGITFRDLNTVISTRNITVNSATPPVPNATFSTVNSCRSTTVTRTGNPPANVEWYWQSSSSGTEMINASSTLTTSSTGFYYLRAISCGLWSDPQTVGHVFVINPDPPTTSPISRCGAGSVTLTGTLSGSANSINWYDAPSGGTLVGSGTSLVISNVSSTTTYYAAGVNTGASCESLSRSALTVTVTTPPSFSNLPATTTICSGSTLSFTPVPTPGGSTFTWTSSISGTVNPASVTASGSGAITDTPINTGNSNATVTYTVTPTSGSCSGTAQTYTVTVKPIPTVAITADQSICSGQAATFTISNPNSVSGTSFSWTQNSSNVTGASGGSGSTINQVLASANGTSQGTVNYSVTAGANGCSSAVAVATVTVKPVPQITNSDLQLLREVCSGSAPLEFTPSSSVGGTTFTWTSSVSGGIVGNSPGGSGTIHDVLSYPDGTTAGAATYVITPVANGCMGTTKNFVVTVVPKPTITISGSPALVYGSSTELSTNASAAAYSWKLNGNEISGATASTYRVAGVGNYTVGIKNTTSSTTECLSLVKPVTMNTASQPAAVNFISTTRVLKAGVTATESLYDLESKYIAQTINYQDGIGRTFQVVGVGMSSHQTDLIYPVAYGRQSLVDTTFLPYATSAKDGRFKRYAIRDSAGFYGGSEQRTFYQTETLTAHDDEPFARTIYRRAPDARVIEQGAPGADWQPGNHTVANQITVNKAGLAVRYWKANGTTSNNYPVNSVVVSITEDENGHLFRTYTNKFGQTVLKQVQLEENIEGTLVSWLETYYVYDVYGRLTYQLPPKAMHILGTGANLDANSADVSELIYKYTYDAKGRLVEKKVPGAATEYIVYDKLDRVVLTQDGNLRANNKWMFVKYDYKNRPVYSGLYHNVTQTTRADVQSLLDAIDYGVTPRFEVEQNSATHGYSNSTFPDDDITVLSVNYYDHYDFDRDATPDFAYDYNHFSGIPAAENKRTRGLSTGSKKAIIDANGAVTSDWLVSVVFYDEYYRPIQMLSNNHLNLNVEDKSSVLYDFVRATRSKTTHTGPTTVNIVRRYTFDHAGRVAGVYQTIDNQAEQQLVAYTYNSLGQLVDKKLHKKDDNDFLQSVDYRYNIRGWLTSINNSQLTSDGTLNDDADDYFGIELAYNTEVGIGGSNSYYNGSINAAKWKTIGTGLGTADQRSYQYTYDKSDKLKAAIFQANDGNEWTKEVNTLNESMTYDHNGNILSLIRNQNDRGISVAQNPLEVTITSTPRAIDNLTYSYSTTSQNQLIKVEDAADSIGFNNNGISNQTEYFYSVDGSLAKDDNKGISAITYNSLAKPQSIAFTDGRSVTYTYAADGTKLKMTATLDSITTTTDYVGGFVYTNNTLSFFGSPEGRVVKNGATYEQQYAIADHQGNTRILFSSITSPADSSIATFDNVSHDQTMKYSNIYAANVQPSVLANHTSGGGYVLRMNQQHKIQATKSLAVYPGDRIHLSVWEYHEGTSGFGSTSTPINALITNVAGAFGGASGAPDIAGAIYNGVNSAITNFGAPANQGDDRPAAYLNYILFDKSYKVMDAGWKVAPDNTFTKNEIEFDTINISAAGFIFVWLSYEDDSNNWVYFDDLTMARTRNNIIQSNEFYPFGMQTATSWTRDNNTGNNFLANGGTELNDASSLYDLEYRNYDPILGRMHQVDPLAAKYSSLTPYNFSFNDPVMFTDTNGADPSPGEPDHVNPNLRRLGKAVSRSLHYGVISSGADYNYGMGHIVPGSGNHWSDQYRSIEGNLMLMSASVFQDFYGISQMSDGAKADFAERSGLAQNVGGGLGGLTNAMIMTNGVSYDAGTFTYQFGGTTYGGTYHTTNGLVTSTATSRVVQSVSGAWAPMGAMEVHEFGGSDVSQIESCPTCLDPSTLHKNLFGLSYPGGNNPRSYNGDYNYSYVPYNKAEYPAIGHDRRYDKLHAAGAKGLLFDTRTIGADWKFVKEELSIAFNPRNRNESEKLKALFLGVGLGLAALPKTLVMFGTGNPQALANVSMWYAISSDGVTNRPSK